jgi:hypothetical protein
VNRGTEEKNQFSDKSVRGEIEPILGVKQGNDEVIVKQTLRKEIFERFDQSKSEIKVTKHEIRKPVQYVDETKQNQKKRRMNERIDSSIPFQEPRSDLLPFPRMKYDLTKLVIKKEPIISGNGLIKPG